MNYFVAMCAFIFLCTLLFLDDIAPVFIRQSEYFEHPYSLLIVPILLMANIFLGIYYNLNIWYKLKNKNHIGAAISVGGASLTLVMNVALIPYIGIMGSALTTLSVYFMMSLSSYVVGQKYYPVPYQVGKLFVYLISALVLFFLSGLFDFVASDYSSYLIRTVLAIVFLLVFWLIERPEKKW
jgi:O-antigen/teichoic acid export membrane protein